MRIIEYKHFESYNKKIQEMTKNVVNYEYNVPWNEFNEPMFPINDERNNNIYEKYKDLAEENKNIIFTWRLGQYKYYSMQDTIKEVFNQSGM